ncbi:putative phage abortive infection protein [Lactococcus formosensis]|uniref:putative phage abortive infection protein n=1 Tax=Lactococcus formosensis TaxID=1281486 RepID=UPI00288F8CB1|nr:putative phage abortive infection protein [Lactococcus formosensis]MDT2725672.1 putative phage abortive infection protein [Lactococcus formosensis]
MKKNRAMQKYFIVIVLAILLTFLFLSLFNPSSSDALNFFGNIIGSIIGVIGAYFVLQKQINNDAQKYKADKDESTYFKILEMFKDEKDDLLAINYDIFGNVLNAIQEEKNKFLKRKIYEEKQKEFDKVDKNFKKQIEQVLQPIEFVGYEHPYFELKDTLNNLLYSIDATDYSLFSESLSLIEERQKYEYTQLSDEEFTLIEPVLDLWHTIELLSFGLSRLSEEDIKQIVNEVYSKNHSSLGNYFRIFHRLIKQITNSSLDVKQKEEYLGITRAILSSEELLVIFYNTFYSVRGEGLKELLTTPNNMGNKTGFFADELDLQNFNMKDGGQVDLPFFKYEELIFGDSDLDKIKSLTNFKKELY